MRLLIQEDVFPVAAQADFASPGLRQDLIDDDDCGPPLRVYVALSDGRLGADLSPEDRWSNRYNWFLRFSHVYRRKYGYDAGIEDQASQIIEGLAQFDLDPSELEKLEAGARTAH